MKLLGTQVLPLLVGPWAKWLQHTVWASSRQTGVKIHMPVSFVWLPQTSSSVYKLRKELEILPLFLGILLLGRSGWETRWLAHKLLSKVTERKLNLGLWGPITALSHTWWFLKSRCIADIAEPWLKARNASCPERLSNFWEIQVCIVSS